MDSETIEYIFAANTSNLEAGARKANAALTSLLAPLKKVNSELAATEKGMERSGRAASNAGSQMQGAGRAGFNMWQMFGAVSAADLTVRLLSGVKDAVVSLGQQLYSLGKTAIQKAVEFDSLKRSLINVAGGADKAQEQLARLKKLAREPGIGLQEAIRGSIALQSIKVSAQDAEKAMKAFSRAVSFSGGGADDFGAVMRQVSQMYASRKIQLPDLQPILKMAPSVSAALTKLFGSIMPEEIQAKLDKAKMSFDQFMTALQDELLTLPSAADTAQNALDNFSNTLDMMFVAIGTPLLEPLRQALDSLEPQFEQTGAAISATMGNAVATIKELWASIPDATKTSLGKMATDISESTKRIAEFFKTSYPEIKKTVLETLDAIAKFWEAHGKKITDTAESTMKFIKEAMDLGYAAMRGDWDKFWTDLPSRVAPALLKGMLHLISNMWLSVIALCKLQVKILYNIGFGIGHAIGDGLAEGIKSKFPKIQATVEGMGDFIKRAFEGAMHIQSPSKVFQRYGQNIVEGLVIGIRERIVTAKDVIKELADSIKRIWDDQKAALLEISGGTRMAAFDAILGKIAEAETAKLIDQTTAAIMRANAAFIYSRQIMDGFSFDFSGAPMGPENPTGTPQMAVIDGGDGPLPPPPIEPWVNFMDTLKLKFKQFKEDIPSIKKALGETFIDLPNRIGDVFANAVSNWDGTFKGFFKSLAQGFADLMRQIAAELIKLMVVKAITSALSGILGGLGGSTQFTGTTGAIKTHAKGGIASGWSWVGEKGPELVNFGSPSRVMTNEDSMAMAGGKKIEIHQHFHASPTGKVAEKSIRQAAESSRGILLNYAT